MPGLHEFSPIASVIISVAIMLTSGFLFTRVTKKLSLPDVTAYILAGIAIGPYGLGLISGEIVEGTSFLPDVALSFIAFSTGQFFRFSALRQNGAKVIFITLTEALMASLLVFVLTYLVLGLSLAPRFPAPCAAKEFFAPANHAAALRTMGGDEAALARLRAGTVGTEGTMGTVGTGGTEEEGTGLGEHLGSAAKAILPLVGVLLVALFVFVREKIPHPDEVVLGVVFSLAGMCLFNEGMEAGLSSLGSQTGRALPHAWESAERPDKAVTYKGVLEERLVEAVRPDGSVERYLPVAGGPGGGAAWIPFDGKRYDEGKKTYEWIPTEAPVAGERTFWGYALVMFFAFAMGLGATLAEPSLNALGVTLEEMTTGTYKCSFLVLTVAVGVGIGMMAGFGRILFGWPLMPMLCGGYALALLLTWKSPEDITAIAWDSAGVTTGPITVPLVIAAGLGIGKAAGASEAFGVVTMASLCPILAVLISGLWVAARQQALGGGEGGMASVGYRPGEGAVEEGEDDAAAKPQDADGGEVAP